MQYTDALTKRMTLLEQQNEHILKQLELFGKTINPSNFMTPQPPHNSWYLPPWFHAGDIYNPSMLVNRDIYTPSTPDTNMQSCPSYIPLPTSTPSRVTRLPLSTCLLQIKRYPIMHLQLQVQVNCLHLQLVPVINHLHQPLL